MATSNPYPIRILWNSKDFYNPLKVEAEATGNGVDKLRLPDPYLLDGGGEQDGWAKVALLDPKVGNWINWRLAYFIPPTGQQQYLQAGYTTMKVTYTFAENVSADSVFLVGVMNADVTIKVAASATAISSAAALVFDSLWNNQMRLADHWTGEYSQKFATFPEATGKVWEFTFAKVGTFKFGSLAFIMCGKHYTVQGPREAVPMQVHVAGNPTGGTFNAETRDAASFRSATFNFPFATNLGNASDEAEFLRMFRTATGGDPIAVQFYHANNQDRNTIYGVVRDPRITPRLTEVDSDVSFKVLELAPARTGFQGQPFFTPAPS